MTTQEILDRAVRAKAGVANLDAERKNDALLRVAQCISEDRKKILRANELDMKFASGISDVMADRLALDDGRVEAMSLAVARIAELPDPTGKVISEYRRDDGLIIRKVTVPIGVIGVIYESRPNVTSDTAALALKSGNVCVLRCGKEAYRSSAAIVDAVKRGYAASGIDASAVNLLGDLTHGGADELMRAVGKIDLLIPRGGAGLIRNCVENAKVPCIQTGSGICHIYVDEYADFDTALRIIENAKCSRPSVCNAAEVCLVHSAVADKFLPELRNRLVCSRKNNKVLLKLDKAALSVLGESANCVAASDSDFDTEFLDYVLAVKIVDDIDAAICHIADHSTGHSEAIITENTHNAEKFIKEVDSAAVYVNASTRFTDGGEFGLGCEIGISTQKLHARGPMGLNELTSYKYMILGNGNIR